MASDFLAGIIIAHILKIAILFSKFQQHFFKGGCSGSFWRSLGRLSNAEKAAHTREALKKSAAALSGSFVPAYRFENIEIHKGFLQVSNLNSEQNPSLTTLAISSELPRNLLKSLKAPTARQILHETAQHTGFLIQYFNRKSVSDAARGICLRVACG